jgi:hypothetical protein
MSGIAEHSFFEDIHPCKVDFRGEGRETAERSLLELSGSTFSDQLPDVG